MKSYRHNYIVRHYKNVIYRYSGKEHVSMIIVSRGYTLPALMTVTVYPLSKHMQVEILQHVASYSIPGRLLFLFVNLCSVPRSVFQLSADRSLSAFT